MLQGFVTAVRTLTVLRIPGKDAERLTASLPWFPAVGFLIGGLLYGCAQLACASLFCNWPEAAAAGVVVAGMLLTGGLHADGLADWADGFFGARDKERILRIMKESTIGAFGAMALITLFLAKWLCVVRLLEAQASFWLIAAAVISRTAQVDMAVSQPYARAEGGTAGAFVRGAGPAHAALALLAAMLLLAWLPDRRPVLAALVLGLLLERWFGMRCTRRIGGITGDLLGACSEMVETAVLFCGALAQGRGAF